MYCNQQNCCNVVRLRYIIVNTLYKGDKSNNERNRQ